MATHLVDSLPSRIEQRLDAQLALAARLKVVPVVAAAPKVAPFITISRQYGCEAMTLAEGLVAKLAAIEVLPGEKWQIYNRQILETLSEHEHLSSRLADALDVHSRSGIEEFFQTLLGKSPPDIRVLKHLVRTERALALIGRCIIVGRGGALLTVGLPGGIHIRLVAPESWRLKSLVTRFGWDEHKARQFLHEEENGRHSFYHKYLGQDVSDPLHYDLVLNVARVGREEQIAAVAGIFETRFPKPQVNL